MTNLTLLGIYVAIAWLWLARRAYVDVRNFRNPERRLSPIENGREVLAEGNHNRELRGWATANGFEPGCVFDCFSGSGSKRLTLSIWTNPEKRIRLSVVETPQKGVVMTEFGSNFENDVALITSGTRASLFYPDRPEHYMQALKRNNLDALLTAHEEATGYLQEHLNAGALVPKKIDYDAVVQGQRRTGAYIESLPLWPLRAPFWFFFRPYYYFNKTIAEQFPRTMQG